MSDLIVVSFDHEATAFEMRAELVKLQREYLLEMEDVVVVTRSLDDKVQLHQAANLTAMGAASGGFCRRIFRPIRPCRAISMNGRATAGLR